MADLITTRARWCFLRTLYPLFLHAQSLPSVEAGDSDSDTNNGSGESASDRVNHLKNEITTLRSDLKLNVIKQQMVEADQLMDDDEIAQGLDADLYSMLVELEELIDVQVLDLQESQSSLEPGYLDSFPRLVALRAILTGHHDAAALPNNHDRLASTPDPQPDATTEPTWSKRYSSSLIAHAASFIRFPGHIEGIESCRGAVSCFGTALERTLDDLSVSWGMETQTLDYTSQDLEAIQHAHDFATTCTSLFHQMVEGDRCPTNHTVKLHLSGFKQDQLQMHIRQCTESSRWVSTVFTRSPGPPPPGPFCLGQICSPPMTSDVLHVSFNSEGMWASNDIPKLDPRNLPVPGELSQDHYFAKGERLARKFRKLAGVLLAASVFQLTGSPWMQHLEMESIFLPTPDSKRLQRWSPQVLCHLLSGSYLDSQSDSIGPQSDTIAAFVVLVLELEADRKAGWEDEDEDWATGERSNCVRLARVSKDWKDDLSDDYRRVAKATLEFDLLMEGLDHPDIAPERKALAIIYKCILEPLFRHVATSFGDLAPIFKGMFGPGRSLTSPMNITASITAKRILFDDSESASDPEDRKTAGSFLTDLQHFFQKIGSLRQSITSLVQDPTHERIRIAVLDSGVDETDSIIPYAIKFRHINAQKSKSFVDTPDKWRHDSYGHGTHVARLLLKTAPAAEIFVGKICTGKVINGEFMPGIAKAIDWAVKECDAHIISISFGFEEENELIDAAIDKAIGAGKLIIAAASNNGGLSGRARPARSDDVICVHATDGMGNKGGMNPSPLPKDDNFATLGVAVPYKWKGRDVWKSGTSFAVPIAVGFAASIMEFARYRCTNIQPRKLTLLQRKKGIQAIFRRMAVPRDGYDFIHPRWLWGDWVYGGSDQQAVRAIEDIMANF